MNILIAILMGLIVVLLVVISFALLKPPTKPVERREDNGQSDMRKILEKMQYREEAERDRELAMYAEKRQKHQAVLNPLAGLGDGDERIHQTNMKAERILIPENLSAEEQQAVREFFDL